MAIAAIVPLRSLHDGKRRLSAVLSSAERTALVQRLFRRAHHALTAAGCIDLVCVVSPDPALLAWAEGIGVWPLLQGEQGLNAGLEYARQTLLERQDWSALLVMLPDLPLVSAADVTALAALSQPDTMVIAPDRHGSGTNALLLQPADGLPFAFGAHSLQQHTTAAQARGWSVRRYAGPRMAFDVDTADDLRTLADAEAGCRL